VNRTLRAEQQQTPKATITTQTTSQPPATPPPSTAIQPVIRPNSAAIILKGQGGAYELPPADQPAARRLGLSLAVGEPTWNSPGSTTPGIRYLDRLIWDIIIKYVPQSCQLITTPCVLSSAAWQALMKNVQAHLKAVHGDASIAGFYILDDYPGNIVDILDQVQALVAEDNRTESQPRPTMCGFGAMLDSRQQAGAPWMSHHDINVRGQDFDQAIVNFSSSACDAVGIYAYAPANVQEGNVDWSMSQLLPYMLGQLTQRGWSPTSQPLIGTPQAFGYPSMHLVAPTGSDLRAQTDAFCHAGAQTIIANAWNEQSPDPSVIELFNDADMRAGLAQGLADCRSLPGWN
jgi:hypothetical protein